MDKIGIPGVIQFFFLEGKNAKEIHERIAPTLGDSCPSYETVRLLVNEFKTGRTNIEDAPRPLASKSAVTSENIDKVIQEPYDSSKRKFDESQININQNKLLNNVKKEENIDSNIEDLEAGENLVENAIYIKEEFSISEESIDPYYQQILKVEIDSNNGQLNESQININGNKLLHNVQKEGNIDSNIEDLEPAENLVDNAIYIKEEFSMSEESIDLPYQQIIKVETDSNNGQDCERNINCVNQITKDKMHFGEQEVPKDMCQATDLQCLVCNEIFMEESHLQKHVMMVHTNVKVKKCLVCGKIFMQASLLLRHMKAHAGIKDYKCSVCNKPFVIKSNLKTHMKVHTGVKDYKCSICNKMFSQMATLKHHMSTHIGVKNNIEEVEAAEDLVENAIYIKVEFSAPKENIDQQEQIINDETDFNNEQDFERMIDCANQISKDKMNSSKQEATKDMCQATALKCSVCNEIIVEKSNLHNHMMMVHSSVKEKKCLICDKSFKRATSLPWHMKAHAGIRDFKCAVCNKMFTYKSNLITHKMVHTSIKDYKCLVCNKMFNQNVHLKIHMTTHTGAKDYKCSICNKMFRQSGTLKYHMTTHTGVKDYKCFICNKMFMIKSNLKTHMKIHAG